MSEASKAAERIANKTDNRCVCGGGLDWNDVHGAAISGARALLEWARSKSRNNSYLMQYFNDDTAVSLSDLEAYFAEESK